MPTLFTHAVIGAMAADLDVLGLRLGVGYGPDFGHRGFTHSLAFVGCCFAFLFGVIASHGLLDAFTNGGSGIAFFWPFTSERYFAPWRPIEVSPLGIRGFFSARGVEALKSEVVWIWFPAFLAATLLAIRCRK